MIQHTNSTRLLLDRALANLRSAEKCEQALDTLCNELSELRASSSASAWADIGELCRSHPIFDALLEDPLSRRAYEKPRGYAGDALMMDLIYSPQPPAGLSPLGKRVHSFVTRRPCSLGARARKLKLASLLNRTLDEYDSPEILSVACGHMRETQLVSPERLDRAERIVAFDQDEASLAEVARSLGACDALSVVPGSVRRLIAGEHELGQFDLIYSLGLYDYLEQPVAQRLTKVLFDALKPGGRLVVANFLPIESSGFMEAFLQWNLIYRTPEEILDMAGGLGSRPVSDKRYGAEHTETIGFLELTKSAAVSIAA